MGFYGSKWIDTEPRFSASCWIDDQGIVTKSYNMSDHTGEHSRVRAKDKARAIEIKSAMVEAEKEARAKMAYAAARKRETTIKNLEYAFLVTNGRGGHTIYADQAPDQTSRIEGYGLTVEEIAEIDRLKIPFIDSKVIPDNLIYYTISFPMPPSRPNQYDAAPWGGMSNCPIPILAACYARLGATVRNVELPELRKEDFRTLSQKEDLALRGFWWNNEEMVSTAMLMENEK